MMFSTALFGGTRTAFQVGLIVIGASCTIGIFIGSVSAYVGGKFDEIVMRFADIFMSFPFLIAAIVITAVLGRGFRQGDHRPDFVSLDRVRPPDQRQCTTGQAG